MIILKGNLKLLVNFPLLQCFIIKLYEIWEKINKYITIYKKIIDVFLLRVNNHIKNEKPLWTKIKAAWKRHYYKTNKIILLMINKMKILFKGIQNL